MANEQIRQATAVATNGFGAGFNGLINSAFDDASSLYGGYAPSYANGWGSKVSPAAAAAKSAFSWPGLNASASAMFASAASTGGSPNSTSMGPCNPYSAIHASAAAAAYSHHRSNADSVLSTPSLSSSGSSGSGLGLLGGGGHRCKASKSPNSSATNSPSTANALVTSSMMSPFAAPMSSPPQTGLGSYGSSGSLASNLSPSSACPYDSASTAPLTPTPGSENNSSV